MELEKSIIECHTPDDINSEKASFFNIFGILGNLHYSKDIYFVVNQIIQYKINNISNVGLKKWF